MSRYSRNIPALSAEEVRLIEECLQEDASRRKGFVPEDPLFILSDDKECGSLNPIKERKFRLEANYDNRWIEVHAPTKKGDLLLATHLYRYDEVLKNGRKRKYSTVLEGGQKIKFTIYFAPNTEGDKVPVVDISYHETKIPRALSLFRRRLKNELRKLIRPILNQPPVLAFTRGIQERQPAYTLALAFFVIALSTTALFMYQSRRRVNPSTASVNRGASDDKDGRDNQVKVDGANTSSDKVSGPIADQTEVIEQPPGGSPPIEDIDATGSKPRWPIARSVHPGRRRLGKINSPDEKLAALMKDLKGKESLSHNKLNSLPCTQALTEVQKITEFYYPETRLDKLEQEAVKALIEKLEGEVAKCNDNGFNPSLILE